MVYSRFSFYSSFTSLKLPRRGTRLFACCGNVVVHAKQTMLPRRGNLRVVFGRCADGFACLLF